MVFSFVGAVVSLPSLWRLRGGLIRWVSFLGSLPSRALVLALYFSFSSRLNITLVLCACLVLVYSVRFAFVVLVLICHFVRLMCLECVVLCHCVDSELLIFFLSSRCDYFSISFSFVCCVCEFVLPCPVVGRFGGPRVALSVCVLASGVSGV